MFVAVRTAGDSTALIPTIREQIRQVDVEQPVANIATMEQRLSASLGQSRLQMTLLTIFAAVALTLSILGIYGVVSYTVSQRNREIGIRMVLGAARATVLAMMAREVLVMIAAGVAIGIAGAMATTRAMQGLLHEVSPTDPVVFIAVALLLGGAAALAAWVPVSRATRLNPISVLRNE